MSDIQIALEQLDSLDISDLEELYEAVTEFDDIPVDIETFLDNSKYLGSFFEGNLFTYWRKALKEVYPSIHHSPYWLCLSEGTEIELLNGKTVEIQELEKESNSWILSYDVYTKQWIPDEIIDVRKTGYQEVFRISFDNGCFNDLTLHHKILSREKLWITVKDLKIGDSLFPYNYGYSRAGYKYVYDPNSGFNEDLYYIVAKWKFGEIIPGLAIHHKDFNKNNNYPSNLCVLPKDLHYNYHSKCGKQRAKWWSNLSLERKKEVCKKRSKGQIQFYTDNPERKSAISEQLKKFWNENYDMMYGIVRDNFQNFLNRYYSDSVFHEEMRQKWLIPLSKDKRTYKEKVQHCDDIRYKFWNDPYYEESREKHSESLRSHMLMSGQAQEMVRKRNSNPDILKKDSIRMIERNNNSEFQMKAHRGKIINHHYKRFLESGKFKYTTREKNAVLRYFSSIDEFEHCVISNNHKIVSIEPIGYRNVYDIETKKYHNFVLPTGIVSHNCAFKGGIGGGKTTAACAGMLYDLHKLLCHKNPQKVLGGIPSNKIEFAIFNVTLSLATDVVWDKISQMFAASDYFSHLMEVSKKRRKDETLFPKRIDFFSGSRVGHSLGRDVFCLTGDTVIPVLSGETVTLKEIVDTYKQKNIYVYSYDLIKKGLVPGKVIAGKKMGKQPVYRVYLSNGNYIDATGNHQLYLRNGKKSKVKNLKIGDRLFPMNIYHREKYRYTGFADPYTRLVLPVYKSIAEWKYGSTNGMAIHHKDFNQRNDDPSNLCILPEKFHQNFHSTKAKEHWVSLKNGGEKYSKYKENQSKNTKKWWGSLTEENKKTFLLNRGKTISSIKGGNKKYCDLSISNLEKARSWIYSTSNAEHIKKVAKRYWSGQGVSKRHSQIMKAVYQRPGNDKRRSQQSEVMANAITSYWQNPLLEEQRRSHVIRIQRSKAIKMAYQVYLETNEIPCPDYILKYFDSREDFESCVKNYNCKITKIEYLGEQEVFDITVDKYHNFSVAGILSSNSVLIDEANFEVVSGQIRKTFYSLLRRMQSRFMEVGGGFPGKIWIVSSETDKSSVLNSLIDEYKGQKGVYVCHPALWEVKPEKYRGKTFKVYKGSDLRPPIIIDDTNEKQYEDEQENIISVPEEHRNDFEASINDALRDLAGVSTGSRYKLFKLKEKMTQALCVNLLFPDIMDLEFYDETDQIYNKILIPSYFDRIAYPQYPRYLHIDIGLSGDRLGLACSYVSQYKEIQRRDITTFDLMVEAVPELVVEFAFAIQAKAGQQIPLFKVRSFILWLVSKGYSFGMISADGYESADLLQLLRRLGFNTQEISVDKTSLPYMKLRSLVYEDLIFLPMSKLLRSELEDLELDPKGMKVDHPIKGSKDMADGVCLSGDTKIPLLNGKVRTIKEIVESKEEYFTYSCNSFGKIYPGKIIGKKYQGKKEIVRVHLDNNEFVDCTLDHLWMMRDGSYKEAKNLMINDSLMPLYKDMSDGIKYGRKLVGYELVYDNYLNKWIYTHHMSNPLKNHIKEFQKDGKFVTKPVPHHKDFNKKNNNPSNIEWMSWQNHMKIHTSEHGEHIAQLWKEGKMKGHPCSEKAKETASLNISKWNSSEEKIERFKREDKFSAVAKIGAEKQKELWKSNVNWSNKQREKRQKTQLDLVSKGRHNFVNAPRNSLGWIGSEPDLGKLKVLTCAYCGDGFTSFKEKSCCSRNHYLYLWRKNNKNMNVVNHKVSSIEFLHIEKDVYDISVENLNNFAVNAGVFVHNCGSVTSALNNSDKYKMMYVNLTKPSSVSMEVKQLFWPESVENEI